MREPLIPPHTPTSDQSPPPTTPVLPLSQVHTHVGTDFVQAERRPPPPPPPLFWVHINHSGLLIFRGYVSELGSLATSGFFRSISPDFTRPSPPRVVPREASLWPCSAVIKPLAMRRQPGHTRQKMTDWSLSLAYYVIMFPHCHHVGLGTNTSHFTTKT